MFLLSDHGDLSDPESRAILSHIQSIYSGLPPDERFWASIHGTGHFNFSDQSLLRDRSLSRLAGAVGSIDARRGLTVIAGCIQQFFDNTLKGVPTIVSANVSRLYPEVHFEA
jgi:hypothetical protein